MFEIALFLGAAVGKTIFGFQEAEATEAALEQKKQQEEFAADKEGIQRERALERLLATQRAEGAARGIAPSSASLSAISRDTFDQFAEDEEARNANLKMKEEAIDQAEENAHRKANWAVFGNLFDAANRYVNLHVPQAPRGKPTGNELDMAATNPLKFDVAGPLDLKTFHLDEINKNIGF